MLSGRMSCKQVSGVKIGVFCWIFLTFLQECSGAYRSYSYYRSYTYRSYRSYNYYDYYYSSGTSATGSLIGGIISGVVFFSVAVGFCVCYICRRRRHSHVAPRFINSATPQAIIQTNNTTPGVLYPPPYNSRPASYGFQPAAGQTVDPPPAYNPPNTYPAPSNNPPNPQYAESAPSKDAPNPQYAEAAPSKDAPYPQYAEAAPSNNPPYPQYDESAPPYESMFGKNGDTKPYPT